MAERRSSWDSTPSIEQPRPPVGSGQITAATAKAKAAQKPARNSRITAPSRARSRGIAATYVARSRSGEFFRRSSLPEVPPKGLER